MLFGLEGIIQCCFRNFRNLVNFGFCGLKFRKLRRFKLRRSRGRYHNRLDGSCYLFDGIGLWLKTRLAGAL